MGITVLSPEEIQEIRSELEHSPTSQAACIEALKIVQRHQGWVSDESISDLSLHLKMSPEEIDAVATFYNLIFRRKVGRHIILVCDSISCWVMGYENVRQKILSILGITMGQTTEDGKFTLLPIVCLGVCEHAPAMMIDGDVHWELTPEKIENLLEKYK